MNGFINQLNKYTILCTDYAHNQYIVYDQKEYSVFLKKNNAQFISVIYSDISDYSEAKVCDWIDGITLDYSKVILKREMPETMDNHKVWWPFHIIRASEVEKFYEYTSSVVINGIECDKFEDAGTVYCDYNYGYIDVLYSGKYEEITRKIPESDLKEVNIRMDSGRYYERKKLIPKKYIDKIILRRKYLYPDLIEFCLEKFYTGEEDVFELDPKNPDTKVLEMMKKYGVIKEIQ